MRKYELAIVLDGKASTSKKKLLSDKVTKLAETLKGKVGEVEDWGVKDLAYKIGKSATGNYLFFPLELESESAKALSLKLKAENDIVRHLLVRKD